MLTHRRMRKDEAKKSRREKKRSEEKCSSPIGFFHRINSIEGNDL